MTAQKPTFKTGPRAECAARQEPEVTIFTAPKAFKGHTGVIQRNAVRSWLELGARAQVILLGKDPGVQEISEEFGILHIPDIEENEYGAPLLNSMMDKAEAAAQAPYLCMINGDILLTSAFCKFLDRLPELPQALYIGLRSDVDQFDLIDFSDPDWERAITEKVHKEGRYRGDGDGSFNGTDYYLYPKGLYKKVPPFAIGRFFWDSWLIASVWRDKKMIVDSSSEIFAIHQNHNYGHVRSGKVVDMYRYWENPELKANFRLAGGFRRNMGPREAPYRFKQSKIARIAGRKLWKSELYNLWYYYPIMIRSSWLFRKTPLNYAFHFLFPFHEATGRHRFSLWGVVKCFLYAFLRPVWKLLPSPIREFAHILLREPGRLLRRPRPAAQARKGKAERSQPFRQWFTDNAKAGHRVICSTDLLPAISNAFGYGYFIARKKWRYIDLDFEWLILDRRELAKIPPSALRVAFANIKLAYRDDHFIALANHKTEPDINDRPWSELDGILTRNAMVEESDVIAILNVWKRGPGLLRRQILGLLDQSYAPREIWICAFGLDDADIYENVAREFSRNGVYFFKSSKNLKYHGRFQIALQADAEYVAFIDDDIIIGRDFLKRCRETMLVTPDAGEVGIYGWRALPAPNNMNGKDAKNYTEGEFIEHLPPERKNIGLVEVDLLCGYHFVRADCLQTLFRTQQWTYSTGEDFQLAFALRKYANKKSYVVPIDPENPNSWGLSADWRELRDHATTIGDMDAVRDALYWRLLNEGNAVNWMKQTPANIKCVYLMYRDFSEAKAVAKAAAEAGETVSDTTRVIGLYCGEDPELAPSAASALSADGAPKFHAYSALNLNLEELNSLKGKSAGRSAELIYALSGLWQALPPRGVYLPREAEELSAVAKIVLQDLKAAVDICAIESPRRFKAEQNRTAASLSSLSAERFERRP